LDGRFADLFGADDGAEGTLEEEPDGPRGGLAGRAAEAGGVAERDLAPLDRLGADEAGPLDDPLGWKGRAIDDNFGLGTELVLVDIAVEFNVAVDPWPPSSVSVFSLSSSIGSVALGSMGSLRSRQFFTRSVIWLKIDTLPSAVS
jgi:hypothetical protein